ncbi:hypothetical protein [Roseibium sp.]|uniref:hypothetical protein n=1 Tax=Roseibium sp. TaxID=1936156 RepID=UPI003D0C8A43
MFQVHRSWIAVILLASAPASGPALADGSDCVLYATDYANAHMGSGDVVGDAVSGGMAGAVAGGAWQGPSGAYRGARAGAALGVLNNLGSMPGGWQSLYDMAYQMCVQQTSGINAEPLPNLPGPAPDCRSTASVNSPMRKAPDGSIVAGSGLGSCR